ncbi:hypothetical protein LP419_10450 [Massilia sp. H-1]|nr:hypothetical protein LP419_10450 [Massilia sp. H-1]
MKTCTLSAPLVLGLALLAALPRHCLSNTGVAFVHGTGNHPDAINDYWSPDFVSSVKQGLPNQSMSIVVNCDFSQYMWTSGAQ